MNATDAKTETLYIITAIVRTGPRVRTGSQGIEIGPVYSCALAYDEEAIDPEWDDNGCSTVDLTTVNKLAAESEDPAATLAAWGIWSTTDSAKAQRAHARALKSAHKRWRLPAGSHIGIYPVGT